MRGSIRRRGANSFELRFEAERVGGKRQSRSVSFRGSFRAAQKELSKLLSAADEGTLPGPTNVSLASYVLAYLDSATHLSPKTKERYRELAAKQIAPHIGELRLQKLRPEHIEHWHAALLATGLAARTVVHAHRLLSSVLTRAVENGAIARNVATVRRPPAVEQREIQIMAPEQLAVVLDSLKGHSVHAIAVLAASSGMRRGEVLGLRWGDCDLERGLVHVQHSVEETRVGGLRLKSPKTRRGRRVIGLPAEAFAMMRGLKVEQLERRLLLGLGNIVAATLVFSTIEGGLLSPNNVTRSWSRALQTRGLPQVSFHSLRHSHASMLLRAGVPVFTVSRRLGHSTASMTLDVYAHLLPDADAAAAKAIEGMLK